MQALPLYVLRESMPRWSSLLECDDDSIRGTKLVYGRRLAQACSRNGWPLVLEAYIGGTSPLHASCVIIPVRFATASAHVAMQAVFPLETPLRREFLFSTWNVYRLKDAQRAFNIEAW